MRILITGAARAIGRATADELLARGHDVVATARDPELLRRLARDQIGVEVCLSSNYHTGAVSRGARHPIHAFLEAGVPVALCCDNTTVSRTDQIRESLKVAETIGIVPTACAIGSLGLITDIGATYTVISGVGTFSEFSVTVYVIESIVTLTTGCLATCASSGLSALRSTFWYTPTLRPRSHFCVVMSQVPLQFVVHAAWTHCAHSDGADAQL